MIPADRPSAEVRARLLAAAEREPPARSGTWSRRAAVGGVLAVSWMAVVLAGLGVRGDWAELPCGPLAQTLVGLIGVASLTSAVGVARGRAMVGVATESLWATVGGLSVLLLALVIVIDPGGAPMTPPQRGPELLVQASGCDLFTLMIALPLLGIGIWFSRGLMWGRPGLVGACIGLGAATWAHLLIRVHCPVGGAGHAVVGHLLPAVPLMLLGAGAMWLRERRRPGPRTNTS